MERLGRVFVLAFVLVIGVRSSFAQETSLTGRIADATDAVIPGVTVTALHIDSGNTFLGVSDGSGEYRIAAMRPA